MATGVLLVAGANFALAATVGADAVVLVNSASAKYLDFRNNIQPYLDHFGVPYSVLDLRTNALGTNLGGYALIIIGHNQLDTNHVYLDAAEQQIISLAVSNGTGLVNFDSALAGSGIATNYQYIQELFNFTYTSNTTGTTVTFPATEPGGQLHFVTARHATNETISLRSNLPLAGLTFPTNATAVVLSSGKPLVMTRKAGQGRVVQWAGYGWMTMAVKGPISGLDDLVWRSLVWAARKPFVIRGMPNHVVMRVDDVSGPLNNTGIAPMSWLRIAAQIGFKPHVEMFFNCLDQGEIGVIRNLVTNGQATASIHSQGCGGGSFFYFDHAGKRGWPDNVMGQNYTNGTLWLQTNGIPHAKTFCPHYSEVGTNAFGGLKSWGVEFIAIEIIPGQVEYATPGAPWLIAGPYRLYETPLEGQSAYPFFYADFLPIPNHPEFSNQFFCCYTEIRDDAACQEWCPDTDVAGSIGRGVRQLKRAFDSQAMGTLFTHDFNFYPTYDHSSGPTMPTNTWGAILQGITNGLSSYQPQYVTMDYACQYVRATRTAKISSAQYDSATGAVNVTMEGRADLALSLQVYLGTDNSITNAGGSVPAFTNNVAVSLTVGGAAPTITNQPESQTAIAGTNVLFTVGIAGSAPFGYQWRFNGNNLPAATNGSYALTAVQAADAGGYSVIVTNPIGSVTSSIALLTVLVPPTITTQPQSQSAFVESNAVFTVSAVGSPALLFQWRCNGTNLPGATNENLTLVAHATSGGEYSVLISNAAGFVVSSNALLEILFPPAIISPPQNAVVIAGSDVTFTASASGTAPLFFQWERFGTNLPGATNPVLHLLSVDASDAGPFTVVVSNEVGFATSSVALLTVLTSPAIIAQPHSQTVTNGANATFTVGATGSGPLHYQWRFADADIVGATNDTYSFLVHSNTAGNYSVVVSNQAGTTSSESALLTVLHPPAVNIHPQDQTVIAGSNLTFTVVASGSAPLSYQWQFNGTNIASATNAAYSIAAVPVTDAGWYAAVVSNPVGTVTSSNALLTVLLPPAIIDQPQNQTVMLGGTITLAVSVIGSGPMFFHWEKDATDIVSTGNDSLTLTNVQTADAGGYSVIVTNAAGVAVSSVALVTVMPPPPAPPTLQGFWESDHFVITFTSQPGYDYVVEYLDSLPAGTWQVLTNLSATGQNAAAFDTLSSTGRYYRVRSVWPPD